MHGVGGAHTRFPIFLRADTRGLLKSLCFSSAKGAFYPSLGQLEATPRATPQEAETPIFKG